MATKTVMTDSEFQLRQAAHIQSRDEARAKLQAVSGVFTFVFDAVSIDPEFGGIQSLAAIVPRRKIAAAYQDHDLEEGETLEETLIADRYDALFGIFDDGAVFGECSMGDWRDRDVYLMTGNEKTLVRESDLHRDKKNCFTLIGSKWANEKREGQATYTAHVVRRDPNATRTHDAADQAVQSLITQLGFDAAPDYFNVLRGRYDAPTTEAEYDALTIGRSFSDIPKGEWHKEAARKVS